jgi:hypothetical protein
VVRLTEDAVVNAIRFPMCGRGIYLPEGRLNKKTATFCFVLFELQAALSNNPMVVPCFGQMIKRTEIFNRGVLKRNKAPVTAYLVMLVMVQWEVENSLLSFDAVDVDLGRSGISFTNQTVVSVTSCLLLCRKKQSEDPLSSSPMQIKWSPQFSSCKSQHLSQILTGLPP